LEDPPVKLIPNVPKDIYMPQSRSFQACLDLDRLPECDSTIGQPNLGCKLPEQAMPLEEKTHYILLVQFEMLIMHVTSLLKGERKIKF
jgi:hypothetical protein